MNPPAPPHRTVHRWADWFLIGGFLLLILAPTLDSLFKIDPTPPHGENRLPAPPPRLERWSPAGFEKYATDAEAYFNDNFGCRNCLIQWFTQWRWRLYHDQTGSRGITGRDHWLFTGELESISHYLGLAHFSDRELATWRTLLEKRRDWLAQKGIRYLFIIPPDKQSVYPEYLPAWLQAAVPPGRVTKLDQFLEYMRKNSSVEILDLRPCLIAAKTNAPFPLYLQLDTHWNGYGSFVAAQELLRTIRRAFPDVPPLDPADFIWTRTPVYGSGDVARMMGITDTDSNCCTLQVAKELPVLPLQVDPHFVTKWGVKPLYITETPGLLQRNIVIFRDSFGELWQPFLGYSFKRAVYEWNPQEFNPRLIETNRPAIVVNEMLERYFNTDDPAVMLRMDALP